MVETKILLEEALLGKIPSYSLTNSQIKKQIKQYSQNLYFENTIPYYDYIGYINVNYKLIRFYRDYIIIRVYNDRYYLIIKPNFSCHSIYKFLSISTNTFSTIFLNFIVSISYEVFLVHNASGSVCIVKKEPKFYKSKKEFLYKYYQYTMKTNNSDKEKLNKKSFISTALRKFDIDIE